MRGTDVHQSGMFNYVPLESHVPQGHPLRGMPNECYLFGRVIIADAPRSAAPMPGSNLLTIEDQLTAVIARERLGEFDGNEVEGARTTLYMYGPDAERLFSGVESTLRAYALCQGAKVIVRRGPPGSPQREVKL